MARDNHEERIDEADSWCPLSGKPCRTDCAWALVEYEMDWEGIGRSVFCVMALIGGHIINLSEE